MTVLDVVVPLVSLLVGSGITYWINVRERRHNYVDDLFNQAIAAVLMADASVDYTTGVAKPPPMSDQDYAAFHSWLMTETLKNWSIRNNEANLALARVVPYRPEIQNYLPLTSDGAHRVAHTDLIQVLQQGPV